MIGGGMLNTIFTKERATTVFFQTCGGRMAPAGFTSPHGSAICVCVGHGHPLTHKSVKSSVDPLL